METLANLLIKKNPNYFLIKLDTFLKNNSIILCIFYVMQQVIEESVKLEIQWIQKQWTIYLLDLSQDQRSLLWCI